MRVLMPGANGRLGRQLTAKLLPPATTSWAAIKGTGIKFIGLRLANIQDAKTLGPGALNLAHATWQRVEETTR